MGIINPVAQQYAEKYTSAEDDLLQEVASFTLEHHPKHHMMSGHLQGKFLEMVSFMIRPRQLLEIGTFMGYSALCLAKGLVPGGQLHTIELRENDALRAKEFFNRSLFKEQIILHIGQALEIIGELKETWDLVFIDADKENYVQYFNLVLPNLRQGGFILADNTLFHGQVLAQEVNGKSAKAIQAFNDYVLQRRDVEKVLLPFRDGLTLIRKL